MGAGFDAAVGYGQLPNGKWSPTVYQKDTLDYLKRIAVAEEITNTDYEGVIKAQGDTVKIMKEPVISVKDYKRGTKIEPQDLIDEDLELIIDQGKYYAFRMDDIESQMSHIDWAGKAVASGAYELKNALDANILAYAQTNATTSAGTGTNASPITIGYGAGNSFSPLDYINRFARLLDENDVPEMNRYFVATPAFWEQVGREDSKLVDIAVTGDPESVIRQRKLATSRPLHGFMCFKSNNVATSASGYATVLAGHKSALSTATTILKSQKQDLIDTFGQQYKGLLVFGRKVLRPEALFTGVISSLGDA